MTLTRRHAMGALAVSGLSLATCTTIMPPKSRFKISQNQLERTFGFGIRKNAHSLTADSDDVRMYKKGVSLMKRLSKVNPLDPLGWNQHWAHHAFFCSTTDFDKQVHYGGYFLPWHRAYLVNLEQKIRHHLNEPGFALPYWDWTTNPTIPEWYFGHDNPLNNTTRLQEIGDAMPPDFLNVGPALRARQWEQFGGRKRDRANDQVEGTLEQSVHNCVHNWIGGEMASFDGAGNDPIFQSHHGQVDRLWEAWIAQDGRQHTDDPNWASYPFFFYNHTGQISITRVDELLDTRALGYAYDSLDFAMTLPIGTEPVYEGGGVPVGSFEPSPTDIKNASAIIDGAPYHRIFLTYERMSLPMHPYHHRLFLIPEADKSKAQYVGTLNILPIPGLTSGLEQRVNSQVEIRTEALKALLAGGPVHVVGVAVPLKGRKIPTQPVPFEGVSLTIET